MAFCHDRDIGHFDRWAPDYDRSWTQYVFFRPLYRRALDTVAALTADAVHILDLGCGTGAFLRLAAERFPEARLTGADPSQSMLDRAVAANPVPDRLRFVLAHAEALPFEDRSFDLVVSTISFHHWADQAQGLSEVARVLRPGAAFFLADHFVIPTHRLFFITPGRRERFHTPYEIDSMLGSAGLETPQWRGLYRIGPLPIVTAVSSRRSS